MSKPQTEGIISGTLEQVEKCLRAFLDDPANRCHDCAAQPHIVPLAFRTRRHESTNILEWYVDAYDADWTGWVFVHPHNGESRRYCRKCAEKKGL